MNPARSAGEYAATVSKTIAAPVRKFFVLLLSRFPAQFVMRKILALLFLVRCAVAGDFATGMDVSFAKQAEDRGAVFKDNGVAKPALQIFREHGYNWVRLRLFHSPTNLPNNLEYTIASAKEAKKLGFKLL